MKKYLLLIITTILFASCSDDAVGPSEDVPFEPTGFMLTYNDGTHLYYNNGKLDSDKGDTLIIEWYLGERTYDIEFLDKDGKTLSDPDPLKYYTYVEVFNSSDIDEKKALATAYNDKLSVTPHDEGETIFLFRVTKSDDTEIFEAVDLPLSVRRPQATTKK